MEVRDESPIKRKDEIIKKFVDDMMAELDGFDTENMSLCTTSKDVVETGNYNDNLYNAGDWEIECENNYGRNFFKLVYTLKVTEVPTLNK